MFDDESPARLFIGVPGSMNAERPDERRRITRGARGGMGPVWVVLLALGLLYGTGVSVCQGP